MFFFIIKIDNSFSIYIYIYILCGYVVIAKTGFSEAKLMIKLMNISYPNIYIYIIKESTMVRKCGCSQVDSNWYGGSICHGSTLDVRTYTYEYDRANRLYTIVATGLP